MTPTALVRVTRFVCYDVFLARTGAVASTTITTSLLTKGTLATTYSPTLQARGRVNKGASR